MELTRRMCEVLKAADLDTGKLSQVPTSTMYELERRGLISSEWRKGIRSSVSQRTGGGMFPISRGAKLTTAGIRAARGVQGLPNFPS
jgi:hypothetical protein